MAVSRYARRGKRNRSAAQRAALKKAQLASARKRRVAKRVAVGTGAVLVAGGAAYSLRNTKPGKETRIAARRHWKTVKNVPNAPKRLRAKIQAFPYNKSDPKKLTSPDHRREIQSRNREYRRLLKKKAEMERNAARRLTPEQREASKKRRAAYLAEYNKRRREQYAKTQSVSGGVKPRKKRAKETKPRRKKTG